MTFDTTRDQLKELALATANTALEAIKAPNLGSSSFVHKAIEAEIKLDAALDGLFHLLEITRKEVGLAHASGFKLMRENDALLARTKLLEAALEAADGMRSVPPVVGAYSLYDAARAKTREP